MEFVEIQKKQLITWEIYVFKKIIITRITITIIFISLYELN